MAIKTVPHLSPKYIGLSTDTKPTIATPANLPIPQIGSTFLEHDTGSLWITHDGASWVLKEATGEIKASPTSNTLLDRLKALLTGIVLAAGSAIIGKVGIDQTTPGTTDGVTEASAAAIKTAVELIDNFISGARGLVTEDNSAAIKTAVEAVNTALQSAGITQAQLANMVTALQLIDDAIDGTQMQVDVVAALPAGTSAIGKVGHDTTGLGHGVKTVTTVGTDEVLATSTACKWVVIQAQTDNTSKVAVGATGVDATVATGNGIILDPGDSVTILIDNLADVYVDALVAGEGVRYLYGS